MKLWSQLRFIGGLLAFSATLLLSTPGIRVARADEAAGEFERFVEFSASESARADEPGRASSSCAAGKRDRAAIAQQLALAMKALTAQAAARAAEPGKGPAAGVQPLNGRGYNYGDAPLPVDTAALRFEAR
jgi:hypothetical protein